MVPCRFVPIFGLGGFHCLVIFSWLTLRRSLFMLWSSLVKFTSSVHVEIPEWCVSHLNEEYTGQSIEECALDLNMDLTTTRAIMSRTVIYTSLIFYSAITLLKEGRYEFFSRPPDNHHDVALEAWGLSPMLSFLEKAIKYTNYLLPLEDGHKTPKISHKSNTQQICYRLNSRTNWKKMNRR